jgi:hypothetical protein
MIGMDKHFIMHKYAPRYSPLARGWPKSMDEKAGMFDYSGVPRKGLWAYSDAAMCRDAALRGARAQKLWTATGVQSQPLKPVQC